MASIAVSFAPDSQIPKLSPQQTMVSWTPDWRCEKINCSHFSYIFIFLRAGPTQVVQQISRHIIQPHTMFINFLYCVKARSTIDLLAAEHKRPSHFNPMYNSGTCLLCQPMRCNPRQRTTYQSSTLLLYLSKLYLYHQLTP